MIAAARQDAGRWNWRDVARQALAFAILAALLILMFRVTSANLQARGVHTGFAFLWQPSATPVSDAPITVEAGVDSYAKVFVAGALNSLKITVAAIIAATVIGIAVGLGRLAHNGLARVLCTGYVELMRNIPVLLHIFLWYGILLELPPASAVGDGGSLIATNRGVWLGSIGWDPNWLWTIAGIVAAWRLVRPVGLRVALCAAAIALPWLLTQRLPGLDLPHRDGLAINGGIFLSPEFSALFIGISLYTAAFIAEIVRAAVGSLPRGQWEATDALGLSRAVTLRSVVLPQALRVAIPPVTSEYLGIFKNSTLAVAIGFQDFMAVSNTMLTDTGQSVEVMAIVMAFYATVSLSVSALMHVYEQRQQGWQLR